MKKPKVIKAWAVVHGTYVFPRSIFRLRSEAKEQAHEWNDVVPVEIGILPSKPLKTKPLKK